MYKRFQRQFLSAIILILPIALAAQETCEPNYSVPYTTLNNALVSGSMTNNQYSTFMTLGQPFIGTATNYSENSAALGFWGFYLKEPRPPLVRASDGDFQNMVLVEWTVEDDRTGPPVTDSSVTLYRNGYVLTQLPVEQTQYQDMNVFAGEYYNYGVTSGNDMGVSYAQNDIGFLNPNGVITGHVETRSGNPMLDTKVMLTPNLGRSAEFDGSSYIYFFDDTSGANRQFRGLTGDYTIETWFRSIVTAQQTIFAAVDSATANISVLVELDSEGKLHWQHRPSAGQETDITTVNAFTTDAEWHHLAAVFESNAMTLYVDGAIVGSTAAAGPINHSTEILLGKRDPQSSQLFFEGRLDDFRLWNLARSWEDLLKQADITLSGDEAGLAAYWKFDEAEGETIFDLTDNNFDGKICGVNHNNLTAPVYVGALTDSTGNYAIRGIFYAGGTTFTVTPSKTTAIGRSLVFNGTASYISFTGERIDLTAGYTIEGWFKTAGGPASTLFAAVDPADGSPRIAVELTAAGNVRGIHYATEIISPTAFNDNLWHHFALTCDNTDLTLYIDGASAGTSAVGTTVPDLSEMVIGRQAPELSALYFSGRLDEFRYWNYARSEAQVGGSMNLPLVGDEFGLAGYWKMNEGSGDLIADATGNLLTGTIHEAAWNMDIPLNEVFEHVYEPESRQATLNQSNTSVDLVNFTDISMIPVSGYVRYANTACFQQGVEMLLNGEPFPIPNYTDVDGKFIVELEPGSSGDLLSCRYQDHDFIPPFIELPMISAPLTALYFDDTMTHNISGIVAGGACEYPITPSQGDITVTLTAVNNCIETSVVPDTSLGTWSLQNLPPLIYNITVDHPDPAIDNFFSGDTVQLGQADRVKDFIYRALPEVSITGFPLDSCYLRVLNQFETYPLNISVFESYINYSSSGVDTNTCPIDTGMVQIITDFGNSTTDTTFVFLDSAIDIIVEAGIPNILSGGGHPYQKSIQAIATDELNRQATVTEWAYVVGFRPRDEQAFATTTPEIPFLIIHRPPGDGSSAYWSESSTFEQSLQFSVALDVGTNTWATAHLGPDIDMETGTPFISVGTNVDVTADFTSSISINMHTASADEQVWTWTTTETVSTVGRAGDVYMGGAMNLLYGVTDVMYIDNNTCSPADSANIIIAPNGFATTYFYSEFQIEEEVIPNLITIGDTVSAALWQGFVAQNEQTKQDAIFDRNLSFDAGVEYQYEEVYETTNNLTYVVEAEVNTELATELGLTINGVGASGGSKINLGVTMGAGGGSSSTHTTTTGYTLADDDIGDSFTVDVLRDQVYATPVFQIQSGFSSCPWQQGTVPRDGPVLNVTPYAQVDVPPDEAAEFSLSIGNDSQSDDDREYSVRVIQGTNPDGAVVAVNGVIIQSSLNFFVPAGEVLDAVMTIARGPEAYIYNDLMIQLVPPCEYESWQAGWPLVLADTVSVSVEFQVPCSESHIAVPEDGWLVAGDFGSDSVWVTVDGYDRYDANLLRIDLQYRENTAVRDLAGDYDISMPAADDIAPIYPLLTSFDGEHDISDFAPGQPRSLLANLEGIRDENNGERVGDWFTTASVQAENLIDDYVLLPFNISPAIIIDNAYQLRAVAVCDAGLVPGTSNIVSGIIDRNPPELLGNPAPVNGILGPDDDIAITFNEDLQCGAINVGAGDITLMNTVTGNPIDFTFTCGGNTIVINPNIENTFIENQTLRASVGPVEDLYGNRSSDPVQWEFFVNRNPLAWVGNAINNVVIWVEDSFQTTRTLMNVGGSNRSYEITNIPDWLTVFPTGGILPPGGAETITFVLNQEPGAGHYIQTVYAHGTMGDEPMPVDIRVLCHPPTWEFSPMNYEYSMNIIALLSVDDVLSEDTYDKVAVFVGDELRGLQNVQYVPELENIPNTHAYQVYLTVFSNQVDGEDLAIQVWDASACSLMGQVIENYTFVANDVLGTPTAPVTISATNQIIQSFDFAPGWSWFSLNVTPADAGINNILASLSPAVDDQIKAQNSYSQFAGSYGWLGTLTSLSNQSMYMIHLSNIDTLVAAGYPVDLETESIPISNGWNWIGYLPQMTYNVNDALLSLISFTGDLIKSTESFSMYLEGVGWLGNLNFMNPQYGYKLYAQNAGTLTYPMPGELLPRMEAKRSPTPAESNSQNWLVDPMAFQSNMSVVAQVRIDSAVLEDPDMLLGAFDGLACRGVGQPVFLPEMNRYLFFLTLYGDLDNSNLRLQLYSPILDKTIALAETIPYQADGILGSPDDPLILTGTTNPGVLLPHNFSLSQNYPNPFNPVTAIEYSLPVDVKVSLIIYNLHGEVVRILVDEFQSAGYKTVTWRGEDQSGSAVPSGIYFYRLTAGDFSANHKLALVK